MSVRLDCRSFVFMMCLCVRSFDTRLCLCGAPHPLLPTIWSTCARVFLPLSNAFSFSGAIGDACRNMVILTSRRECLQVGVGLRTSAALLSMSLEVLSGVVWVVRSRVPKIWLAAGAVSHQLVRSVSPCVSHCTMPLAAALRVVLFSFCAFMHLAVVSEREIAASVMCVDVLCITMTRQGAGPKWLCLQVSGRRQACQPRYAR